MPRNLLLVMGVKKWLDSTKDIHLGHGFRDFEEQLELLSSGAMVVGFKVTKSSIGRMFGVHRHTIQNWIDIYNKEHAQNNDRSDV